MIRILKCFNGPIKLFLFGCIVIFPAMRGEEMAMIQRQEVIDWLRAKVNAQAGDFYMYEEILQIVKEGDLKAAQLQTALERIKRLEASA